MTPFEQAMTEGLARVEEGMGRLTGEVSGARQALADHVVKDDERFRKLENFDAETTGQRRIDDELKRKVAELEAQRTATEEKAQAKRDAEAARAEARRAAEEAAAKAELAAQRASTRTFWTAIASAAVAAIASGALMTIVSHVVWR